MQTIYNEQGVAKTLDSVDAREHVATGRWFRELPVKEKAQEVTAVDLSVNVEVVKDQLVISEVNDATTEINTSVEGSGETDPDSKAKAKAKSKDKEITATEILSK